MDSNKDIFFHFLNKEINSNFVILDENITLYETLKIAFYFTEFNPNNNESPFKPFDTIERYLKKNIHLIIIQEQQWLKKQAIIKSRIASILGKSKQIHGRKTKARRIDKKQAEAFLAENHLQGYVSAKIKYGLFLKDELVAVATFSAGRKMNGKPDDYRSFELIRFANKNGYTVVGGLSKLLKAFVNDRKVGDIMTYVDRAWSQGKAFEKIGFQKTGELAPFKIDNIWNVGSLKFVLDCKITTV